MYLDHSAIAAVLLKREGWSDVARRIEDHHGKLIISSISFCEAVMAVAGEQPTSETISKASLIVSEFLEEAGVKKITISIGRAKVALEVQRDHLKEPDSEPLASDEMIILGIAKSFGCGVLATSGRFANL